MPALPLISIVIILAIHRLSEFIKPAFASKLPALISGIFLIPLLVSKYEFIVNRKGLKLDLTHYELSNYLKTHNEESTLFYLAGPYDAEFYYYSVNNPRVKRGKFKDLEIGNTVAYGNLYKDSMSTMYTYTTIDSSANARKILIQGVKNQ
jgi:hypothetical protein